MSDNQVIPEAAIEAAWDYIWRNDCDEPIDKPLLRAALEVAAPHMLMDPKVRALEEAADAMEADPYDNLDPYYAEWLRDRAEKIREGE